MSALSCDRLVAGYGDLAVVRGLTFQVAPGEVMALLGPNGSGKTTLLSTLAGLQPALGGTVHLLGEPVDTKRVRSLARRGLAIVPDDRALFGSLSTVENLNLGIQRRSTTRDSRRRMIEDAFARFPALVQRRDVDAGQLSGGEQQMLAMARAFISRPAVLLIDEMSMGLAPTIVEGLLETVRRIADEDGTAVILVEQHVQMALRIADSAAVMVRGEFALHEDAKSLRDNPDQLAAAYLGEGDEDAPTAS